MSKTDYPPPYVHEPLLAPREFNRHLGMTICEYSRSNVSRENFAGRYRVFRFYALTHLYEGSGVFLEPGKPERKVRAGDALVVFPGQVHWYSAAPRACWKEDSLCFHGPAADGLAAAGFLAPGVFALGDERRLAPLAEQAADPSQDAQFAALAALHRLLADIYFKRREEAGATRHPRLRLLLHEIRQTPQREWNVEDMARACHMDKDHFRRVFRRVTGLNPKRYLDEVKIGMAAETLKAGGATLREIAERMGFADVYHFSRRFKQLTGLSPKTFRNRAELQRLRVKTDVP